MVSSCLSLEEYGSFAGIFSERVVDYKAAELLKMSSTVNGEQ